MIASRTVEWSVGPLLNWAHKGASTEATLPHRTQTVSEVFSAIMIQSDLSVVQVLRQLYEVKDWAIEVSAYLF